MENVRVESGSDERREDELRGLARELGAALWPGLRAALRTARLELEDWLDAVRRDPVLALSDERALARQEALEARARRIGWCLGVLVARPEADLLRERHADDGLRWMVGAVSEALALALVPPVQELPSLSAVSAGASEVSLLAGWSALQAGASAGALRWSAGRRDAGTWLAFELGHEPAGLAARCARLNLAGMDRPRLELRQETLELSWS